MNDRFSQFVQAQKSLLQPGELGLTVEQEKALWLDQLDRLAQLARRSLKSYLDASDITMEVIPVDLWEEQLGSYKAPQPVIRIGPSVVKLKPLGSFFIGARGRVDMEGPRGICRLLIVPPEAGTPQFSYNARPDATAPEAWVWKIATQPPHISYLELTEESFRDALMGVVNGR